MSGRTMRDVARAIRRREAVALEVLRGLKESGVAAMDPDDETLRLTRDAWLEFEAIAAFAEARGK